jgi:hypothetical protein
MGLAKLSNKKIREEILREARVLGMHPGTAKIIADNVVDKVLDWCKQRSMITEEDLNNRLSIEIKKYNADLAYLFESKGKII